MAQVYILYISTIRESYQDGVDLKDASQAAYPEDDASLAVCVWTVME